ncbi:MAG: nuclear transport factor 2 family protein [Deltaproteobacteria bacterium]|nr:nuclear transport factor 2 family protein [Deltaproteobacteria bacterium]
MPTTPTRERALELVDASPACVARHDKDAWLALFTEGAVVEDPVGSAPHRKGAGRRGHPPDDELGRFWDTFIAPNDIRFEVREDIVAGREVARDVLIHTRLSTGLELTVPSHLLYQLAGEAGALRIGRLAAHWELPRMSLQALRGGGRGLATMARLSLRMLRIQGLAGTLGYSRGMVDGVGRRGRDVVESVASAVAARDEGALAALFSGPGAEVEHPVDRSPDAPGEDGATAAPGRVSPARWLASLPAGARLSAADVTPAGWSVSFRFELAARGRRERGLAFLRLDRTSGRVASARFFVSEEPGADSRVDPGRAPR